MVDGRSGGSQSFPALSTVAEQHYQLHMSSLALLVWALAALVLAWGILMAMVWAF